MLPNDQGNEARHEDQVDGQVQNGRRVFVQESASVVQEESLDFNLVCVEAKHHERDDGHDKNNDGHCDFKPEYIIPETSLEYINTYHTAQE